jgi:uncharacterized protein (DUF2235 family)
MPKNIVICCDGTGNEYGDQNSNVIKLYRTLQLGPLVGPVDGQIAYYHPGVGTMGSKNALTAAGKGWTRFRGLAFGYGISENIADAYQYLMRNFETNDRIFIFGFSRGAYTARALCGLLQMFGLLRPGNEGLIPYAIRLFKRNDRSLLRKLRIFSVPPNKFRTAAGFKKAFCRNDCKPHFLGVWDTVSSVGRILDPFRAGGGLPYTYDLGEVSMIRHAVSIDERRAFFRQNLAKPGPDFKEVWFPGVHSDVGGSYPEAESGLSKISLRWMLREAQAAGLVVDQKMEAALLGENPSYARPQPNAVMHNSMTVGWWVGELLPKRGPRLPNFFRRRTIPNGACLHQSALDRKILVPDYQLKNAPAQFTVEDAKDPAQYPIRLKLGDEFTTGVHAGMKWNDVTISLEKGARYRFAASGRWYDAAISCGPDGYPSPSWLFRRLERFRRFRTGNWFQLIGTIGKDLKTAFPIGTGTELDVQQDGILYCFANDLPGFYGNNSGSIQLYIQRVTGEGERAAGAGKPA